MKNYILTFFLFIISIVSYGNDASVSDARKPLHITSGVTTYDNVDFGRQQVNTITIRAKSPRATSVVVTDVTTPMPTRWGNRPMPKEYLERMKKSWGIVASVNIPASDDYQMITFPVNSSPKGIVTLKVACNDATIDWIAFDAQADLHPALLSDSPLVPWSEGAFKTGQYRNLYSEMGYSDKQISEKLKELYDALFNGPDRIYFEVGDSMAIISDVKNHDARTEGMSYGMMIAVQLDQKDVFDRLYRWAKRYMQMKEGRQKGYFAWSVKPDGTMPAMGAAADGELYFITSLIFASNRWGNDGDINYLKEAQEILDIILGNGGQPRLIDEKTKLIAFVPGASFTDPSYHIPAFYEVWAEYAQDGRSDYWRECAREAREYLHRSIHPLTGLNPDYNNFDGSLLNDGRIIGDAFRYDSWRVPINIALDFSWSHDDAQWQTRYGNTLQDFLYKEGIDDFLDQYNIDGTTVKDTLSAGGFKELRHTPGFIATAAAVSLVCSHAKSREFLDRFWNNRHDATPSGYKDAYYEGILRLFAFMHLSGNYRIITK